MRCTTRRDKRRETMTIFTTLQSGKAGNGKVCKQLSYSKGRGGAMWPGTCCKPVKVVRDGVGYCGIHDPVHQIEMQRKRDEKAAKA